VDGDRHDRVRGRRRGVHARARPAPADPRGPRDRVRDLRDPDQRHGARQADRDRGDRGRPVARRAALRRARVRGAGDRADRAGRR
jgi:hypothetical protein